MEKRLRRLAVLIDGDNTPAAVAEPLFARIADLGEATVRRIYGDFSGSRLRSWSDQLSGHGLLAHQTSACASGKNAADIALVIDAMDLLHVDRVDAFCLVSSDSDFTRLASRIREQGVDVFGFGERKTPQSFQKACRAFIHIETLLASSDGQDTAKPSKVVEKRDHKDPILYIRKAIEQVCDDKDGWAPLSSVGNQLASTGFDRRKYGSASLTKLVEKLGAFDVKRKDGKSVLIRARPAKK
jgi:uncharacterized LabA/DUF88 family protein